MQTTAGGCLLAYTNEARFRKSEMARTHRRLEEPRLSLHETVFVSSRPQEILNVSHVALSALIVPAARGLAQRRLKCVQSLLLLISKGRRRRHLEETNQGIQVPLATEVRDSINT